jgi:hypothetical protein
MFNEARLRPTQEAPMPKNEAPLFYISSKGVREDVNELHLARFGNAIRLIEREGPANPNHENLERLRAVFERRQTEWEAANPDKVQR